MEIFPLQIGDRAEEARGRWSVVTWVEVCRLQHVPATGPAETVYTDPVRCGVLVLVARAGPCWLYPT